MRGVPDSRNLGNVVVILAASMLCGCATSASSDPELRALVEKSRAAVAMYQERCKTAGVKIHRTFDNVDGVFVMRRRPETDDLSSQNVPDPYGRDLPGDAYLKSLLKGSHEAWHGMLDKLAPGAPPPKRGYHFVEAMDPADGMRYRYTGALTDVVKTVPPISPNAGARYTVKEFVLSRTLAEGPAPRYAITYDDIATPEERAHWVAASSLKVIDLQTHEVIAERLGFMVDPGQGATAGGRAPWIVAASHACPRFSIEGAHPGTPPTNMQMQQTQRFVEQVLIPKSD